MCIIIGLTGGMCTGKSTTSAMFRNMGATIVDLDGIVRQLQAPGSPILSTLFKNWPAVQRDSSPVSLDRDRLAEIVFNSDVQRRRLERIMHPLVAWEMVKQLTRALLFEGGIIIVDHPLLFETGWFRFLSTIVVVYATEEDQLARMLKRCQKQVTETEALRRIRSQWPIGEKIQRADVVIDNTTDLKDLELTVRTLWAHWSIESQKRRSLWRKVIPLVILHVLVVAKGFSFLE